VRAPFFLRDAGGLLQMQSTVFGLLRQSVRSPAAFLPFLLPAGSVSGTPKKRAREILAPIESATDTGERGAYTGIVGLQCADGSFESAVAIRSLFADARGLFVGIGAGITTLSVAADEASEFAWKLDSVRHFWEGAP